MLFMPNKISISLKVSDYKIHDQAVCLVKNGK